MFLFFCQTNGDRVPLTEFEGIDVLANCVESSVLSVNRFYYGDLHNMGHVVISAMHDPDGRHLVRVRKIQVHITMPPFSLHEENHHERESRTFALIQFNSYE